MRIVFLGITILLFACSCKTIKCREYHRRYVECTTGTNRTPLEDERTWTEKCEATPEELLPLDCNSRTTCYDFLRCVDNKE